MLSLPLGTCLGHLVYFPTSVGSPDTTDHQGPPTEVRQPFLPSPLRTHSGTRRGGQTTLAESGHTVQEWPVSLTLCLFCWWCSVRGRWLLGTSQGSGVSVLPRGDNNSPAKGPHSWPSIPGVRWEGRSRRARETCFGVVFWIILQIMVLMITIR